MGKRIAILTGIILASMQVYAITVSQTEFDEKYQNRLHHVFCKNSEFSECFPLERSVCDEKFLTHYTTCKKRVLPKGKIETANLDSRVFSQLGSCIGDKLARAYPQKRKIACHQRPLSY